MKLEIYEIDDLEETQILIKCQKIDYKINRISDFIKTSYITINGKLNGEHYVLNLDDIYYFEAVDKEVYEVGYKLQELVDMLVKTSFIQVSRTVILNINKIEKVSTLVNGRISAFLVNQEKMIITRVYARDFKKKLSE